MSMQGRHKTGQALMHAILGPVAIYTLAPLVFLIFNSFKSNNEIIGFTGQRAFFLELSVYYQCGAADPFLPQRHLDHLL